MSPQSFVRKDRVTSGGESKARKRECFEERHFKGGSSSRDHSWEAVWPALIFCLITDASTQIRRQKLLQLDSKPVFSLCRVSRGEGGGFHSNIDPSPPQPRDYLLTLACRTRLSRIRTPSDKPCNRLLLLLRWRHCGKL